MFTPVGKGLVVVCGILTLLSGLLNIFHNTLGVWCSSDSTQKCVGPALKWNSGDTPFTQDSNKDGWRTVLTLDLNAMIDIWSPVIMGTIILSTASISTRQRHFLVSSISYSWTRMASFLIITALFRELVEN